MYAEVLDTFGADYLYSTKFYSEVVVYSSFCQDYSLGLLDSQLQTVIRHVSHISVTTINYNLRIFSSKHSIR